MLIYPPCLCAGWIPSDSATAGFTKESKLAQWPNWQPGTTGCSGSGTRADEFGAEASRSIWRVALDALWFGEERAIQFSNHVSEHATLKLLHSEELQPGCAVGVVFPHWAREVRGFLVLTICDWCPKVVPPVVVVAATEFK